MALIYTKRLGAAIQVGVGITTIYTAPTGLVSVVRSIGLAITGGTPGSVVIYIAGVGTFHAATATALWQSFPWSGRMVVNPGEHLNISVVTNGQWECLVTGYQLS